MDDLHLLALDYRCAVLPDDAHEAWVELEEYVKQLINEEREACAVVLDEMAAKDKLTNYYTVAALAIRARGQS